MTTEKRGAQAAGSAPGHARTLPRQPRGSADAPGSPDARAPGAEDPVRDRIDSDWAPGVPDDLGPVPTTWYRALAGRVHALVVHPDGSRETGEVPPGELTDRLGGRPLVDGWYSITGEYLGEDQPV